MLAPRTCLPLLGILALGAGFGCARPDDGGSVPLDPDVHAAPKSADSERALALETLRAEETALRARTDFAHLAPSSRSLGANPYALVPLPPTDRGSRAHRPAFAGVLRGDSALVLLDESGTELSRARAPLSASSLASLPDGRLFVSGDVEPRVARYRVAGSRLVEDGDVPVADALSLRAVAADPRVLFAADFWGDRLYSEPLAGSGSDRVRSQPACAGPIRLALSERFLGVVCLFDHAIALFERGPDGLAVDEIKRIVHDGPIFALSIVEIDGAVFVAAGGVEDHPLDRRDKAFGHVDSFVYLYRIDRERRLERLAALNTSELGVVSPKVTTLLAHDGGLRMRVFGYASDRSLTLDWDERSPAALRVTSTDPALPGCSDVAPVAERLICANPLFDGWVTLDGAGPRLEPVRAVTASEPSSAERLGEALFFTTLMAPDATAAGRRSRFTCETCHFEGATDGRIHNSGRGDVRVTTRPLFGLFNGAPHFSRAHDPDLTSVSNNEFGVANRGNPVDPWFTLSKSRFPWLSELGVTSDAVDPLELRRDLLVFLARFSHTENPLAVRRPPPRHFTDDERRGAEIFRRRCAGCHAARLVAQDETKAVAYERWEELVLSPEGPIVWSNGEYAKTGVVPYVDPKGTRTPSLRRLYLKRPYLTNGSASTLDALLRAARYSDEAFLHATPGESAAYASFTSDERRSLVALLELL
jgi:hypothetical protein